MLTSAASTRINTRAGGSVGGRSHCPGGLYIRSSKLASWNNNLEHLRAFYLSIPFLHDPKSRYSFCIEFRGRGYSNNTWHPLAWLRPGLVLSFTCGALLNPPKPLRVCRSSWGPILQIRTEAPRGKVTQARDQEGNGTREHLSTNSRSKCRRMVTSDYITAR